MKKKFITFTLTIFLITILIGCGTGGSGSSRIIKQNPSIFYSDKKAGGFIDFASIDITNEQIKKSSINIISNQLEIDKRVKEVCDYLISKGYEIPTTPDLKVNMPDGKLFTMGVPIISMSYGFYSYPSWFTKTTDYQGTRVIEVFDNLFIKKVIQLDENSVYALPFKIIFFIYPFENRKYLHIGLLDPIEYLKDFDPEASQELISAFETEKNKILTEIKNSLLNEKNISFINEKNFPKYNYPDVSSLIKLATVKGIGITNFVEKFLKTGDIITTLDNGTKVRYIAHNPNDPNFPYNYSPMYLNDSQTEITGILSFCRFILPTKNIWLSFMPDNKTINYASMLMLMPKMKVTDFNPPKSDQMEFLIKNSITHIYARYYPDNLTNEKYITFSYTTPDGRKIYQLSLFDPYIAPAILTTGQWHKPFLLLNIYIKEKKDGSIEIITKNPEYLITKYFSDVNDSSLIEFEKKWNDDPNTMFYWPAETKEEFGEISLNKIKKLIKKTLEILKNKYNISYNWEG